MEVDTESKLGSGSDDEEESSETLNKLSNRAKQIKIADYDVNDWEQLMNSFKEHYKTQSSSKFARRMSTNSSRNAGKTPLCVLTDLFSDENILSGFTDGTLKVVNENDLNSDDALLLDGKQDWKHNGLSDIRCSRVSPFLFFSSSTADGIIRQWDVREASKKCCQKFASEQPSSSDSSKSKKKPILKFDVSCNDQLLCGGTEKVEEDSYLLFWDTRSTKLLGAYWESHSDDVTGVSFHHSKMHALASGSTDGLLNVFNLLEPAEEDALLYSFNTNSSVDSICWNQKDDSKLTCVTHTNEVQVWDSESGDRITEIDRKTLAKAMMRSNPDAVYISSCRNLPDSSQIGLMACSFSGGNTRLLELNDEMQPTPRGIFMDQTAVIQTSQILSKSQKWITFDEHGVVKLWEAKPPDCSDIKPSKSKNVETKRSKKRFNPYHRD